jgi:hypothetical protein
MDTEQEVLANLEEQLRTTEAEIVVLQRVLQPLSQDKCFRREELQPLAAGLQRRQERAAELAQSLATKRLHYKAHVLELRRLIARREDVLQHLNDELGFLDRFAEEAGAVLDTQAQLTLDLQHAEAELHNS